MQFHSHSFSCSGPNHENQDSVLGFLRLSSGVALAIADGIGGKPGGEIASKLAIETLKNLLIQSPQLSMQEIFGDIRLALIARAKQDPTLSQMGTTLSVCIIGDSNAKIGHVGDTRVYHLRGEGIMDRTKDQTEVQQLIDQGVLSKARAKRYQRRNVLMSALGVHSDMDLFEASFSVEAGDRLILLSDGVYELVPRREIRDISIACTTPEQLAVALRETVESRSPKDDYTAICAEVVVHGPDV